MNPFERLDFYKSNYTKSEKIIYEWIKKNPTTVMKDSIESLAEEISTSKAAIIRFSKKIGYSGFAEFKFELSRYIISGIRENKNENMDISRSITSLYAGYIKQINDFIDLKNIKKRYHPTTMIVIENDEDYQLFKTDHKDIQAAGELMKVRR